jgi:hypothetical protein
VVGFMSVAAARAAMLPASAVGADGLGR